jgi:hypothetical protein
MNGSLDLSRCPLCGGPNRCQRVTQDSYKGPCWCFEVEVPEELLRQVPPEWRNAVCVCRGCIESFLRTRRRDSRAPLAGPGDFYFENGLVVFTEVYLRRRGYCCGSRCRHCPYEDSPLSSAPSPSTQP